jgi:alkanesulfonate monooxygenase SsuD/methylene tetrahydromethanopterin reductase-like flavin-dependent oxidoreductase (luciferase family)
MGSTLDIASKGRLEFGIGAGWKEDECIMYGIPFPRPRERIERLHEAVQVIQELWHKDVANFKGKYYALTNAVLEPKPIQKPHPPIWIGAKGEKLALPVVAELADGYNTGPCSLEARRMCISYSRLHKSRRNALPIDFRGSPFNKWNRTLS